MDLLNLDSLTPLIGRQYFDPAWEVTSLTEALLLFHELVVLQHQVAISHRFTLNFPRYAPFLAQLKLIPLFESGQILLHGVMGVISEVPADKADDSILKMRYYL